MVRCALIVAVLLCCAGQSASWGAESSEGGSPGQALAFAGEEAGPQVPMDGAPKTFRPESDNSSLLSARGPGPSPFGGSIFERSKLTGNWWGARDTLWDNGMTLDVSATQFYQGVASGGINQTFGYSGRNDYLFNLEGEKAGLWEGFFFNLHGETRYGTDINNDSGTILSPPNIATLFPLPTGAPTGLTAVKFSQYLADDLVVYAGKFNMLDELYQPFGAGRGVDAFMNTGLVFPVVLDRTVPYSTLGAGFSVMNGKRALFTLMVFDTHNTPTTSGFESFFTNGATTLSKLDLPVFPFGLPGHQGVEGTYSTGTYTSLRTIPYIDVSGLPAVSYGSVRGSWSVFYVADQALYVDPTNPQRSWGVFTNIGVADQDPSPIRFSASVGLGGSSPLVRRPLDTFGIGYSYVAPSLGMKSLAPPNAPFRSDHAVELFYNIAITPSFRLTPNLQFLVPGPRETAPPSPQPIDADIIVGLRAKIDF